MDFDPCSIIALPLAYGTMDFGFLLIDEPLQEAYNE